MAWPNLFPARKYTKFISWDILITIALGLCHQPCHAKFGHGLCRGAVCRGAEPRLQSAGTAGSDIHHHQCVYGADDEQCGGSPGISGVAIDCRTHAGESDAIFRYHLHGGLASFSSPIGYQTNLIVQGIGNYRFGDFVRIGLPLNLISLIITLIFVPMFWPF